MELPMTSPFGNGCRIATIECLKATIPIEAPVLTCYGSLAVYSRNIVKITTESGLVGWGECSARVNAATIRLFEASLRGFSVFQTTLISGRIKNWSYYDWQKPEPIMAAIEMACLDLQGKLLGVPLYDLLGGRAHAKVAVSSYTFYRHNNAEGSGEVHTVDDIVAFARDQVDRYGFDTIKLKGGYFPPEVDRNALEALRDTFGRDMRLRIDPQGAWTPTTAIRIGRDIDRLGLEYYEDPCWNAAGMARVRRSVTTPLATNMCVTCFEQFHQAVQIGAVDVVLADLWYWGGLHNNIALDILCTASGIDVGMHSSSEFGIGWAAMIHTACAMPHLKLAMDNMNLHLRDDIIVGGKIVPVGGEVAPPEGPGLGIEVDEEKLRQYTALATSDAVVDRVLNPAAADSERPGWYPEMPAW
jgi:glucarate dehydratase